MTREIDNNEDTINYDDVVERIEDLRDRRDDEDQIDPLDDDEAEELAKLEAFAEECESYVGQRSGATLIRDSYFKDYARDCAEDQYGREMAASAWPFDCIDWERAARELRMDYTGVEFDGVTYWVR